MGQREGREDERAAGARARSNVPSSDVPGSDASANEDFLFHLYRGSELLQDNRVHEAKNELERALTLQPRDSKGQDLLAVVYFRLGLYPRAIQIYEDLRKHAPNDASLLLNLSLCYMKTGQQDAARLALERVVEAHPNHGRAWGYLGLVYQRAGDLVKAERAFQLGGFPHMARRMTDRADALKEEEDIEAGAPSVEAREAFAVAYQELDAGELSFELAKPASESSTDATSAASSWASVEIGQPSPPRRKSVPVGEIVVPQRRRTQPPPDTRDGPPDSTAASLPVISHGIQVPRRPTLMLSASIVEQEALSSESVRAPRAPNFGPEETTRASADIISIERAAVSRREGPVSIADAASDARLPFAPAGRVAIHRGLALVRTAAAENGANERSFAVRLESIRAIGAGVTTSVLEKRSRTRAVAESFGGMGSPVVRVQGSGDLVLGPRPGHTVYAWTIADLTCFVREDVVLGFDLDLDFENGKLATGEGEHVSIVQLRGSGALLAELMNAPMSLDVREGRGVHVRRDALVAWFGRIVPRALPPGEAPCGQRGLIAFAGEGTVLVSA